MTFTISNLKTGDLVICANGKMATVMKGTAREDVLRFILKTRRKLQFRYDKQESRWTDNC